ncbi:MAG: acetolactate decarboxylase [Thermodesulfobacteriota bacterium]|nr:acetolactate decarboxylase [Thermodesulfobacteriota bacterium]
MKKSIAVLCVLLFLVVGATGCLTTPPNTLTQISTIDAILAGAYDGQITCKELLLYGDFGIGTFDRLDGEMILTGGKIYQVKDDGKVYTPSTSLSTPFASVVKFDTDIATSVDKETNFHGLEQIVDGAVSNINAFCAIRVKGLFRSMKTRSVPAQNKPYAPLVEITRNQPVFNSGQTTGTVVGFRCPVYVKGINVPGYHLHFISEDFTFGGHILEFILEKGTVEIDTCNKFFLILPEDENTFGEIDLSLDRSGELEEAER